MKSYENLQILTVPYRLLSAAYWISTSRPVSEDL
jgi:hypothetical protein